MKVNIYILKLFLKKLNKKKKKKKKKNIYIYIYIYIKYYIFKSLK